MPNNPSTNTPPGNAKAAKPLPAYPPSNIVDDPDALRPGSANDPRNINKVEPLHLSAGIGDDAEPTPDVAGAVAPAPGPLEG